MLLVHNLTPMDAFQVHLIYYIVDFPILWDYWSQLENLEKNDLDYFKKFINTK